MILEYRKVTSSNTSRLEAHAGFFRLLMKGTFDSYVLWPFDKKVDFLISNATIRYVMYVSMLVCHFAKSKYIFQFGWVKTFLKSLQACMLLFIESWNNIMLQINQKYVEENSLKIGQCNMESKLFWISIWVLKILSFHKKHIFKCFLAS